MAQVSNVRVENLAYTLKELQNEKVCLEQKLQEQQMKQKSLKQNLDQEASKCAHVQEKHRRMAGTFAVGQQKVDMTMTTCISLQKELDKNKPELERMQQAIENERKLQQRNIKEFEAALSEISTQLFHARSFYKKTALQDEINTSRKAFGELENELERGNRELQGMNRKLLSLTRDKSRCKTSNFGCEDSLFAIYSAMERDRQETEEYRNKARAELREIKDALNESMKESGK